MAAVANRLDLDDLSAQVRQHHAASRAHHHVGELDDPDVGVRQADRVAGWDRIAVTRGDLRVAGRHRLA